MSNYRTEMNIPVTRDNRTFEQRRKDMLNNLGHRTSTRLEEQQINKSDYRSDTTASSLSTDSTTGGSTFGRRDNWDHEVDRWINESRSRFGEEMNRMRRDIFALEPVDTFWKDMPSLGGDHDSMMARMERQMKSMSEQMHSLTGLGPSSRPLMGQGIVNPSGTKSQSSSSRIVTSSSTTSSGSDPRAMKKQSNVQESVSYSQTVNGQTTGSSSHSSTSTSSKGHGENQITGSIGTPGALIAETTTPTSGSGMMGFLKDAYELDEDGQVHFKVRFDAKDFAPEDIDVTTVENRLTVNAKKALNSGESETIKEFSRTVDLPRSIDHERFQCHLTDDGVLILDAPVKAPDNQSITFGNDNQLGIRPTSSSTSQSSSARSTVMQTTGVTGPTIIKEGTHGRKLHLEVSIEPGYKADDLCVRTDANRIVVSGKRFAHPGNNSSTSQFTRSYEIPETVDPFTVTAQLTGTTLVIEAPLLCSV